MICWSFKVEAGDDEAVVGDREADTGGAFIVEQERLQRPIHIKTKIDVN